jgi:hypothetical protein
VTAPAHPSGLARVAYDAAVVLTGRYQGPIRHRPIARPIKAARLPSDDRTRLVAVLGGARRRSAAAMPHSPEWEAAASAVDAYELELDALDLSPQPRNAAPRSNGVTTNLDFGPITLPDAVTIQGAIVGRPDRARAVRF